MIEKEDKIDNIRQEYTNIIDSKDNVIKSIYNKVSLTTRTLSMM